MKINKIYILLFSILIGLNACKKSGEEPKPLTDVEKISRTWQVSKVLINGQEDTSGVFSGFRITFNSNSSGEATTYTVTPGNAVDTPNLSPNNQGVWSFLANNTQIVLDQGTDLEISIRIEAEISESSLIISWTVPEAVDKSQPTYRLELMPL